MMNLTYVVSQNGYTILNNGQPWVVQTIKYIPYPVFDENNNIDMVNSAKAHIDVIENEFKEIDEQNV